MSGFFRIIIFFVCLVFVKQTFAQAGYIGKHNLFELKFRGVPSYKYARFIEGNSSVKRRQYFNANYSASIGRVVGRRFEVTLGCEVAKIKCLSDTYRFEGSDTDYVSSDKYYLLRNYQNFIDDPVLNHFAFMFSVNRYWKGSLAPFGKYMGLSFIYGQSSFSDGETISLGKRGLLTKEGKIKSVGPVADQDIYQLPTGYSFRSYTLRGNLGRNFPINDFIMVGYAMSFPIWTVFQSELSGTISPWSIKEKLELKGDTDWVHYTLNSIKFYNRVSIEICTRIHF